MKPYFQYDGTSLTLRLVVEDESEYGIVMLMDKLKKADVRVDYGETSMYSYRERERPHALEITLTKPIEPEPEF